jgi:hypothetical protein
VESQRKVTKKQEIPLHRKQVKVKKALRNQVDAAPTSPR